ncbi:TLC domain-containing protein 3A-like [Actinia tenebrosa]|uniref:TLC domain-containing protein 3A-like n=1 Tax=Actinia tenebrosa TaxID=6105 RepID=A0A6P8HKJ6_ACTTE|nr:TLC domain-containing protein 3A-like [Actinia tenebrosa]
MIFAPGLFIVGTFLFPVSHTLITYLLKHVLKDLSYVERFGISTRIVSGIQAIAAAIVGLQGALSCQDILDDRIPAITDYLCFGLTYFYYDTVVMFYAVYMKEKAKNPRIDYISAWKIFYKKKRLIIFHHIFLPIIGFPISNFSWIRNDKGDFFIAVLFMSEFSTPFLSIRAILAKLGKKKSPLYIINGLLLAIVFFVFRVLVYPYLYWKYANFKNISYFEVPFSIPLCCNVACFLLMSLQVNWSYIILKGCFKYLQNDQSKQKEELVNCSAHYSGQHTSSNFELNSTLHKQD